jgi:hypothetical protein
MNADDLIKNSPAVTPDDRIARFFLQSAARELMPKSDIQNCLRAVIPGQNAIEIHKADESGHAWYKGLRVCRLCWVCPICASRISERRRQELAGRLYRTATVFVAGPPDRDGLASWYPLTYRRYHLTLITYTLKHSDRDMLPESLARLQRAYRMTWSGRWAAGFMEWFQVIGTVRGLELTHGGKGWHPHIHQLLVSAIPGSDRRTVDTLIHLRPRWLTMLVRAGGVAHDDYGLDIQSADEAGDYPDKSDRQIRAAAQRWDLLAEVSKNPVKRAYAEHRTLWDLLADYAGGDVNAGGLWIEAQRALRGKAHLLVSPTLYKALEIDEQQISDKTLAEPTPGPADAILARLTVDQWRLVIRKNVRGQLLAIADMGGKEGVANFMREIGGGELVLSSEKAE